jgi:aminopeptidase N
MTVTIDNILDTKKFELAGSRAHYAPSLLFTINKMQLSVEPDFNSKTISCKQQLELIAIQDIDEIVLDISELQIKSVFFVAGTYTISNNNTLNTSKNLDFHHYDGKLHIKLGKSMTEGVTFHINIIYSAKPRKGFYFIGPDEYYPKKNLQAWTQGETVESKSWFPCIDHPMVKFESEVSVAVPMNFIAISNGILQRVKVERRRQIQREVNSKDNKNAKKKVFTWIESNPHSAYLTSIVIGRFTEIRRTYNKEIKLFYYVPEDKKNDAERSFEHTADMIKFFEQYFDTEYPYSKYSQITVEDFMYGGMENASCTTLTVDTLHDKKAHLDFTSDHLVSHELAHQWFGDLVTCRDWQHIWLNEGFATYCEALYWEASRGTDEFQYYIMQTADDYFDEANSRYKRPIVTKIYKQPDDLFDRHTYEKSGCIIHMLRSYIGDKYFRRSLRTYLQRYSNRVAETDDLRKILELESGTSLQQFFDQWIFKAGHPELKVELYVDSSIVKLKIEQSQEGDIFEFPLDIKLVFSSSSSSPALDSSAYVCKNGIGEKGRKIENEEVVYSFVISEKENVFQFPIIDKKGRKIEWISIDPYFRVLKTISLKAPKEMLIKQLQNGRTVIERVESARNLKNESSEDVIESLRKSVMEDGFWGVSVEAAKTLGLIKSDFAYEALRKCLSSSSSHVKHPKVRRAIVRAIGEFRKEDSLNLLKSMLTHRDRSYFVEAEVATAIGKIKSIQSIPILRKAIEMTSFQDIIAQGAIKGLKEFRENKEIAALLIEKSKYGYSNRIREAATFALGKFVQGNHEVFDHLKGLLTDKWLRVRINACRAFADAEDPKAIPELTWVIEHDIDYKVIRIAEECLNLIKESMKTPKEVMTIREDVDKLKLKNLEVMQKMSMLERQLQ